jgi:hypothetical protein
VTPSCSARSVIDFAWPLSIFRRQRCARTSVLTASRGGSASVPALPLRGHDQLPATATLQPDRDADGQGMDLETQAFGHYSAASAKGSEAAGVGASWSASPRRGCESPQHAASRRCRRARRRCARSTAAAPQHVAAPVLRCTAAMGSKDVRSGGVNRDRSVRFSLSAAGGTADLSWRGFDGLVV